MDKKQHILEEIRELNAHSADELKISKKPKPHLSLAEVGFLVFGRIRIGTYMPSDFLFMRT